MASMTKAAKGAMDPFAGFPTIYFSLERNRATQEDPTQAKMFAPVYADIEDGYNGVWKNSYTYKWELLDKVNQVRTECICIFIYIYVHVYMHVNVNMNIYIYVYR
jgi:hypothetical protein